MSTNRSVLVPSYRDLKWRLEIKSNSRSAFNLSEPLYTVQLTTANAEGKPSTQILMMDYAALAKVTETLEAAYKSMRTTEYRRIARLVK